MTAETLAFFRGAFAGIGRSDSASAKAGGRGGADDNGGWDNIEKPGKRASFTDFLPWMEYLPEDKAFLLEDGRSVGAVWEIEPVGTEGRSDDFKTLLWERAFNVVADAVPEVDPDPWILQVFVSNDFDLSKSLQKVRDHVQPIARGSAFTEAYLKILERHYERLSRPGGVFKDKMSGTDWRGKVRRVRFVLYRRLSHGAPEMPAPEELGDVAAKLELALANVGVKAIRYDGEAFYDWMVQWLNPRPAICDGDVRRLRSVAPYPGDDDIPFGRDFAELLTFSEPTVRRSAGIIDLDGMAHSVLTIEGLRRQPKIGHYTGEQAQGDETYTLMDKFPDDAILSMAVTFRPQDMVMAHVGRVKQAAVGDQIDAALAGEEADAVIEKMGRGDRLYPVETVIYVSGENEHDLRRRAAHTATQLATGGVQPIPRVHEKLSLDRWLGNLPMAFRPEKIKRVKRSRFQFASHIAANLPVYGRSRGTGNPGLLFFNRGGEPQYVDPLCPEDRKKNSHTLFIGPTGAGKTGALIGALMQETAIHRPRLFIVEVGGVFNLFADFCERHGLTVNRVTLRPGETVSLPPFADALRLWRSGAGVDETPPPEEDAEAGAPNDNDDDDERRDILGEMEIAAKLMITGGQDDEMHGFSRSDRLAVRQAILKAAETVDARDGHKDGAIVRPVDVAAALRAQSADEGLTDLRRDRVRSLADALDLFADEQSLAGQLFNREGEAWPEADVTVVDLAMLAREGYEAELAVAYVSLMNHVNNVVERKQYERRQSIVVTDEAHIITRNELLASYVAKITKMWRKLGTSYWPATQNLADFSEGAKRILNMVGFIIALVMPKEEVDELGVHKQLDEDQRRMMLGARKEPGCYAEGVILSDVMTALIRLVHPAFILAMAMNEKHEKAERAEIMRELGLEHELDAAHEAARRMEERS